MAMRPKLRGSSYMFLLGGKNVPYGSSHRCGHIIFSNPECRNLDQSAGGRSMSLLRKLVRMPVQIDTRSRIPGLSFAILPENCLSYKCTELAGYYDLFEITRPAAEI